MRCGLALLAGLVLAGFAPTALSAAPGTAPGMVLEHLTDVGSSVRLGFGVSPLRGVLAEEPAGIPGVQDGESGTVVSFDLNLAWPGAGVSSAFEPYIVLGPALFVVEPDAAGRLLGTRVDPTVQVGARAGAGVTWWLGRHAALFGGYEITTAAPGGLVPSAARPWAERGIGGYDFTYGLRLVY